MGGPRSSNLGTPAVTLGTHSGGKDIPAHCPPTLRKALERTYQLAVGQRRRANEIKAAYLVNQAAACLGAWRAEEISPAVAVALLDRIAREL